MKKILLFLSIVCICFSCCAHAEDSCGPGDGCGHYEPGGDVEQKYCLKDETKTEFSEKWLEKGTDCTGPGKETTAEIARCKENTNKAGERVMSCKAHKCKPGLALWLHYDEHDKDKFKANWGRCRTEEQVASRSNCNCAPCKRKDEKCKPYFYKWRNPEIGEEVLAFNDQKPCECQPVPCADLYGTGTQEYRNCECAKRFPNDEQKRACCELGKEWDDTNNTCKCDGELVWDKDKKQCVKQEDKKQEEPKKEDSKCKYVFKQVATCPCGKQIEKGAEIELTKEQVEGLSCEAFQKMVDKNDKEFLDKFAREKCKQLCGDYDVTLFTNSNTGDNKANARAIVSKFFDSVKKHKTAWRTLDGKFNTARLASDLTAGVVLGTVGGVVSGVVIKKKQVEKGFDALRCTVGGLDIAGWGDQFRVELQ